MELDHIEESNNRRIGILVILIIVAVIITSLFAHRQFVQSEKQTVSRGASPPPQYNGTLNVGNLTDIRGVTTVFTEGFIVNGRKIYKINVYMEYNNDEIVIKSEGSDYNTVINEVMAKAIKYSR